MGQLINGEWQEKNDDSDNIDGKFERKQSSFREQIYASSEACPLGKESHIAQKDRYHLYISHACPWAHRAVIFRKLKGLESIIGLDVVHPHMLDKGWAFKADFQDSLYQQKYLYELYLKAAPSYIGKVTVPVLWDKKHQTIVNNESSEMIRIFNHAFDTLTGNQDDLYPIKLQADIDAINDKVYNHVNNGVYKCGFATTQAAYDEAYKSLFTTLEELDAHLGSQQYLVNNQLTEADIRLFTTLIRFDVVYYTHFKCNHKRIQDYKNLFAFLKRLLKNDDIRATVHLDHIKEHYFYSHHHINPNRIVPKGPLIDWL